MKLQVIIIIYFLLLGISDVKSQSIIDSDKDLIFVDSNFVTQMCIGKSLSYYRKIFLTNDNSLLRLKVYDHKGVLIGEGYLVESKKNKYLPHGQWRFYTESGKLRKAGTFDKGYKVAYWFDYDLEQKESYKTFYRKEDQIANEQIAILDAGINLEIYFDIKDFAIGIKK
jgi:hypothetical protein